MLGTTASLSTSFFDLGMPSCLGRSSALCNMMKVARGYTSLQGYHHERHPTLSRMGISLVSRIGEGLGHVGEGNGIKCGVRNYRLVGVQW
jgi:hypothetical protein